MENNGINIGGKAKVNIGNAVVGANSTINATMNTNTQGADLQELLKLFDSLTTKLTATSEPISGKEDLVATVATLKEEVSKEKPNKITLGRLGKTLLENLKYAKDVAPIAEAVWQHISALL